MPASCHERCVQAAIDGGGRLPHRSAASSATLRLSTASAIMPSSWWRTAVPTKPTARPSRRHRGALGRRLVGGDAVQVQQDQAARRPAQVVHPGDRLLAAVAALVQVHGGGDEPGLGRDRAVVGLPAQPRDACARPGWPRRPRGRPAARPSLLDHRRAWRRAAPAGRRRAGRAGPGRRRTPVPHRVLVACGGTEPAANFGPGTAPTRRCGQIGEQVGRARPDQRQHRQLGGRVARLDLGEEPHHLQVFQQAGARARLGVEPRGRAVLGDDRRAARRARSARGPAARCPGPADRSDRCWVVRVCSQLARSSPGTAITSRLDRSTRPTAVSSSALLAHRVADSGRPPRRRRTPGPDPRPSRRSSHSSLQSPQRPKSETWPTSTRKPRSAQQPVGHRQHHTSGLPH